ncbi:DUF1850 domain-containing protein [Maledivibacter halophilus]|uniref:DUF1850 domain-containing protein n=1 Tax=Maledivibacter halophilus TaxID=36842 RepID=A0A1T5IRI6_9FIRM|nr:DUF1850 domain-containing protein [Maledivibacter halophilus]SKC41797.1 hypothetical protein SAMN02194393_00672 [Maledivibacter halophilus]
MKKTKILTALILIIFVVIILIRPVNVFTIKNYHDDEVLLRKKIHAGYEFATLIKHSVHKTPVYEYYKIDKNGKMLITGTALMDLGWGVPSTFDYDFKFENNMIVIENINKIIEFLPFRISYIAKPRLILNNKLKIDLTKYVDNYERIDVSVQKMPYITYLIRGEVNVF